VKQHSSPTLDGDDSGVLSLAGGVLGDTPVHPSVLRPRIVHQVHTPTIHTWIRWTEGRNKISGIETFALSLPVLALSKIQALRPFSLGFARWMEETKYKE